MPALQSASAEAAIGSEATAMTGEAGAVSTALFDAALAELTELRRKQQADLEAATTRTRREAMSVIANTIRAQLPEARYLRFDDGAGMGGMLDRGWGYARLAGIFDGEHQPLRGLVGLGDSLQPMERQLTRSVLERQFGAVHWPDAVNSPVVDLDQITDAPRHDSETGNTMRITNIALRFEDGTHVIEGYTTPGWYLSAADADADGHLWSIRPAKITPELAETIAQAMAPAVGQRAVAGIRAQNQHAREQARKARERADALAANAAYKAEELAVWEAAVFAAEAGTATPDFGGADRG